MVAVLLEVIDIQNFVTYAGHDILVVGSECTTWKIVPSSKISLVHYHDQ